LFHVSVPQIDDRVCYVSRIKGSACKQRDSTLQSKQMGNRTNRISTIDGRIVFDVLQVIQKWFRDF
jgi:hypothetical protein